jgi:hypothetical protein
VIFVHCEQSGIGVSLREMDAKIRVRRENYPSITQPSGSANHSSTFESWGRASASKTLASFIYKKFDS